MYRIIGADGKEYGPITAEQLRRWIAESRANAQSQVWAEGATDWKPLGQLPEFADALAIPPARITIPAQISALPPAPRNNPMAVTGLIMGIVSVTLGLCCYGAPFNVLGVVFSLVGLSQIKKDPQREQGRGLAIAGLVLSLVGILIGVLLLILVIVGSLPDILKEMKKM